MTQGTTLTERAKPMLGPDYLNKFNEMKAPVAITVTGTTAGFNALDNQSIMYAMRNGKGLTHTITIINPHVDEARDADGNDVSAVISALLNAIGQYRQASTASAHGRPLIPFGTMYDVPIIDDTNHYKADQGQRYYVTQEIIKGNLAEGQPVRLQVQLDKNKRYLYLQGVAFKDFNAIQYGNTANNNLSAFAGDMSNAKAFDGAIASTVPEYNGNGQQAQGNNYNQAPQGNPGYQPAPQNGGFQQPAGAPQGNGFGMPQGGYQQPQNNGGFGMPQGGYQQPAGAPQAPQGNGFGMPQGSQQPPMGGSQAMNGDPTTTIDDSDLPF